jgi:CHC2 zinc finger
MIKRDIVEVIGERIKLRLAGREYFGHCPFHDDRHPSFYVNREKGVYLCRGCQAAGDVIDFVMLIDGVTFNEACKSLGIKADGRIPAPRRTSKAATLLAQWMNQQYLRVGARCRELSREIALAEEIPDPELVESFNIEWEILSDLHEALAYPREAAELWSLRELIERITGDVEPEALPEFPPLTDAYRAYLRSIVA